MKTILTITMILSSLPVLKGQEIRGLPYNHAVVKALEEENETLQKSAKAASIQFETEFFEDFSDYHRSVFPRSNYWADRDAFINSTYPDSMISLGVATLDAYDERGFPYYSDTNKIVASDTLTSLPILFADPNIQGSYFFSFFYEPGGKGDMPESNDTLLLDFYNQKDGIWVNILKINDVADTHHFKQAIVEVPEAFLVDSFRFRFRNYTSLPGYPQGQDLGAFGNSDMWHIDYIQLKKADNASEMQNLDDIMITEPLLSSLKEYTSVPWRHYSLALSATGNERNITPLAFRTYFPEKPDSITSIDRNFASFDLVTENQLHTKEIHNSEPPFDYNYYQDAFKPGLLPDTTKSIGKLLIRAYINGSADIVDLNRPVNDTVKRFETFYDHYAYDDGTAEMGMGIGGENQDNAKMALRFRSFRRSTNPDLLKAVLIYFCKSVDGTSAHATYTLSIRKNIGPAPDDEVLYKSEELNPEYDAGLNEFTRIEIDPPLVISDTFFVVIEQNNGYLNVGYDINNNSTDKLYFYVNQQWHLTSTLQKGAVMVRPSFDNNSLLPVEEVKKETPGLTVFPNPVADILNFAMEDDAGGPYELAVYNILGINQLTTTIYETSLDIGFLPDGMYFITIRSAKLNHPVTSKFLKQ